MKRWAKYPTTVTDTLVSVNLDDYLLHTVRHPDYDDGGVVALRCTTCSQTLAIPIDSRLVGTSLLSAALAVASAHDGSLACSSYVQTRRDYLDATRT